MSSAERVKKHRERQRAAGRRRVDLPANDDAAAEALRAVADDMIDGRLRATELLEVSRQAREKPKGLEHVRTIHDFLAWVRDEGLASDEDWVPPRDRTPYSPTDPFE